ncbi:EF-hand domain pair [Carpediemonas membranifera]|uniref:EF-hand domain pair n=1 Tax=Carpediemonas membranifera TaxID=201153 RepID=A0A8J6AS57_9EUKA|nr:EF-hand domain pair [Carpediemonas membranifera]|eukprot:KAG9392698.1 EF-hand domain pair [Carpediemonas membranifera]
MNQDPPPVNVAQLKSSEEIFNFFDTDHSGTVNARDLERVFSILGVDLSSKEAQSIITELDMDKSGKIDFIEFSTVLGSIDAIDQDAVLNDCFSLLAGDSGTVSLRSLFSVLKSLGFTSNYDDMLLFVSQVSDVALAQRKGQIVVDRKQFAALVRLAYSQIGS